MNDRIESAALTLDLVQSLLTTIAASMTSASGTPSPEAMAGSLLGVQRLVDQARATLAE